MRLESAGGNFLGAFFSVHLGAVSRLWHYGGTRGPRGVPQVLKSASCKLGTCAIFMLERVSLAS